MRPLRVRIAHTLGVLALGAIVFLGFGAPLYPPSSGGLTPPVDESLGGTGAANTATAGRILIGTGTAFVTGSGADWFCADGGSTDAYACNLSPAPTGYVIGACYTFKANTANTTAATLDLNSLGAKTIKKVQGGITTDLETNDIRAGQLTTVCYDGTNMQMQSTLGNAPAGSGGVNSGVTNALPKYISATTLDDSLASDDGTTLTYTGTGGVSAPSLTTTGTNGAVQVTNIAAPSTPAAGKTEVYADSTTKNLCSKNDAGAVSCAVPGDTSGPRTLAGGLNYCADAGASDAYACSLSPAITAYNTGTVYFFKANTSNTGAASLNLNSLGAKNLKIFEAGAKADPHDNCLRAGQFVAVIYDGTDLLLLSPCSAPTRDVQTDTFSASAWTSDFSLGLFHTVTAASATCTATFNNGVKGAAHVVKVVQDGSGSRCTTMNWPAAVKWPGGTAPVLTTASNKADIFTFLYDGTTYFGQLSLNYTP